MRDFPDYLIGFYLITASGDYFPHFGSCGMSLRTFLKGRTEDAKVASSLLVDIQVSEVDYTPDAHPLRLWKLLDAAHCGASAAFHH